MSTEAASPAASNHLLGNGDYAVMLTGSGSGCSRWKGLAVTRRGPVNGRDQGSFVYLRDCENGNAWSATARPCGGTARYWYDTAMARFARRDSGIDTTLEVTVDPDRPLEVRGIGLLNNDPVARTIELTSYLEPVLGSARDDDAHPAYSKMFVQTTLEEGVLLAWRRKKSPSDPDIWIGHALVVDGREEGGREWETDRARFIGRDRGLAAPAALDPGHALSGTVGTVLDPVLSLRTRLRVEPGTRRRAAFVTMVGTSRDEVLAAIQEHATTAACSRVFQRARNRAASDTSADAAAMARYQRLAGALLHHDPALCAPAEATAAGAGGAPVLWAKGISGDLPIVLARVAGQRGVSLVEELLQAQAAWRHRQLFADIVVVDEAPETEAPAIGQALQHIARDAGRHDKADGNLFVLRDTDLDAPLRAGLFTAARVVLDGRRGGLAALLPDAAGRSTGVASVASPRGPAIQGGRPPSLPKPGDLEFWNGTGGFARNGREYVTVLGDGLSTPAPWTHVVANPGFGFLATAAGGGYCWAVNSQQNAITPWSNDAVCDPPGEVFLLRDQEDGTEWSATASPLRARDATYIARFGPGHVCFEANVHGIESELTQCVAASDPVKLSRLRLHNRGRRARRLAVACCVDWMLGPIGSDPRPTTRVDIDVARAAAFARNPWRDEFTTASAFVACNGEGAMPGNDGTRGAVVAVVELEPDASTDLLFLLGEGSDRAAAEKLVDRYRKADFDARLASAEKSWDDVATPLQVETPQRSLDLLVNRWLPYQVLACRMWARTAFYQASGAFGFRDQLQDVAALCIARPDVAREHILLSASRQFEEGDVQHWWLPPSGRGVRTRIVDDRLWLPLVAAHYIATTGDRAILGEKLRFLHGDALQPGQADVFFAPSFSADPATLYEHCARAIEASLATGVHGLPLMGTGDWNDGMNRVGAGGKGESVWMGWFLYKVIAEFAPFAEERRDLRAAQWRDHARALELALETKAWDGDWYRRAFYDDGTPLGSSADDECRVESMAQSWAVISGAGDPERAVRAMRAVNENLVRPTDGVVALFAEPFDHTPHDPGYIRGYPPGLRENGGQYTHGSLWSLVAFAMLGDGDKVGELLEIFDPVRKSDTPEKLERYKVEPYVQCADVYSVAPHVGRGGWTWYSGSAGWTWRAIVEWVLGIRLREGRLHLEPCVPRKWKGYAVTLRRGGASYRITVDNPHGACRGVGALEVDGVTLQDSRPGIVLRDDGCEHTIHATLHKDPD